MFNEAQKLAINHIDGPMMVLAGAGSGKTTILTNRIKNLVVNENVEESRILVVTFTVAAALEMKARYENICNKKNSMVNFGTFHRIFFSIIREEYNLTAENIISNIAKYELLKNILLSYNLDLEDEKEVISKLSGEIAKIKEGSKQYSNNSVYSKYFKDIYKRYHEELRANKLIDFEDMEVLVYKLFQKNGPIYRKWKNRYDYILIDEFQDINNLQYKIIKMMINEKQNIFIVGDDDQSIYGFRGSDPNIMLNFPKEFPDTKTVMLEYNYRSGQEVVDIANKLITNNKIRFNKKYKTVEDNYSKVNIKEFSSDKDEFKYLAKIIKEMTKSGTKPEDIAILVRTNSRLGYLTFIFNRYSVQFQAKDYIPNIYDNFAIKDILTYLRLAIGKGNREDFIRIINKPVRYISVANIKESGTDLKKLEHLYRSNIHIKGNIITLREDLDNISKLPPSMAIKYILNIINYKNYLIESCQKMGVDIDEVEDKINYLIDFASGISEIEDLFIEIEEYKKTLLSNKKNNDDKKGVYIMTIHGSKGLEFKHVFIIDVNESYIPHNKADNIEEERRLFYVAITRAIESLNIYYSLSIAEKSIDRSRFIDEIVRETK